MSSPPMRSDDELFDRHYRKPTEFETVETVPVDQIEDPAEHDTLVSLPALPGDGSERRVFDSQLQSGNGTKNTSTSQHFTQPTQLIDRSPPNVSSPTMNPTVQVAASSPTATPVPASRKPMGYLASAMAPAGTAFRRPFVPSPSLASRAKDHILISSDDERIASDESDREERARSDIKPSNFVRKNAGFPAADSYQDTTGLRKFQSVMKGSLYQPDSHGPGVKRPADTMANAYGNVYKKARQTAPSKALPIQLQPQADDSTSDIDPNEIDDYNTRSKLRRMASTFPGWSNRAMLNALTLRKGNYDDAVDYLMQMSEKKAKAIDLTGSDDELSMTPAVRKMKPPPAQARPASIADTRQQVKKPTQSIANKWSSTQAKKLNVFDTPPPVQAKARKLIRGRKTRTPSPSSHTLSKAASDGNRRPEVVSDDSEDEATPGQASDEEPLGFNERLLHFFNTCSAMDLVDTASIQKDLAEHFVSQRPFKTLDAVEKVEKPNLKTTNTKRKTAPIGVKVVEKVDEMIRSYDAVDFLVRKCEDMAKPLAAEMKAWGVDVHGKSSGELDMTSLSHRPRQAEGHRDSGIGTPISDDDKDVVSGTTKRFIRQPVSLAEDIVMKDYQIVGVNWLNLLYKERYSCILADDMGLGKTLQTIAFLAHLAETGTKGPHLIVVPAATLENWLKEFERFCPGLVVHPYYAPNPSERFELREEIDDNRDEINVIITTYTIAKAKDDFPWLKAFGFICTIFDEGHVLKNADSKVSKSLMRIKSDWRLLLTGTPLQNNLKELISLLFFLMPDLFKQKQEELQVIFRQDVKTINEEDDSSREILLSKKRIARARTMLTPFILRRKKQQVLKDLPKKDRKTQECELLLAQEEIYCSWIARAMEIRQRRLNGERSVDETANILMKLRQAALHPMLFRRVYTDSLLPQIARACLEDDRWEESNPDLIVTELREYNDYEIHKLCAGSAPLQKFMLKNREWDASGKVRVMIKLLKKFIEEGHKTLIFSQFVMVLDILELVLSEHGIRFYRLDGSTKVSERQDLIDEFNEEIPDEHPDVLEKRAQQTPVFMLSTKAGGAGINLASASRVIIFDSGFNPQDDVQAENRAHRIGQKREVEVWRLITKSTVEEQIYKMGINKLQLDKEVAGEGVDAGENSAQGQQDEKSDEKKEVEGMRMVEEMLFQSLDARPEVSTSMPRVGEKDADGASGQIEYAPGDSNETQLPTQGYEGSSSITSNEPPRVKSEEEEMEAECLHDLDKNAAAVLTAPSSDGLTASKQEENLDLPSRPKGLRPKMPSRQNSTRSHGSQRSGRSRSVV